eukprot:CAMPEP_0196578870 /NCGR_PEP_ID=MMETSP1081-20130531/11598_1 /TAXON_ID=36882 /ORGANISM="Pyramimonas amylifera, Strain CCMP720" /LENGTH=145 /DNA_ID=CAMNT_0041898247 /DNA_START=195 /DNA_END=632 /DNA_ORIENTATION=-
MTCVSSVSGGVRLGLTNRARDVVVRAENPLAGALEGWLDVTKLVSSGFESSSANELAQKIGDEMYADINGWHLYMRDMKLQNAIAAEVSNQLAAGASPKEAVAATLARIPVTLGKKNKMAIADITPDAVVNSTVRVVEDFVKDSW